MMRIVTSYTFLVFLCSLISLSLSQTFNATTIPSLVGGNPPIISATEDAENVTMFCEVLDNSNGQQVLTRWSLLRNSSNTVFFLFTAEGEGQEFFENMMVTSTAEFRSNLTILVFNSSFDNTQIGCGGGTNIDGRFDMRIIKPPILRVESIDQIVGEGNTFEFDIEEIQGFPVIPETFTWYFNGVPISDGMTNPNISVYPFIRFTTVSRSNSGNYSILATNEGGLANGFFILNVHYKPEGVAQNGPKYVLAGDDSVTIIGFISIDGNPGPSSVWSRSGVSVIGARFNTSALGVLTISSVILNDAGNYTNTLNNTVDGVPMSINNTIELVVAESPSMPRNVDVLVVGAEYVNISWTNPVNLGTPVFSQFRIRAVSSVNEVVTTIDATNRVDPDFINTYILTGLKPSAPYSLNITALSTVEQLGVLVSEPSEAVLFNTTLGAPNISRALLNNINGNLSISWEFRHTGGSDLLTVTVQCSEEEEEDSVDGASADPLAVILQCSAAVDCLMGSVSVGPVTAGGNYSCLVTAENNIGSDKMRTDYIIATTGIPSVPVIIRVSGGAGFATITLRVDNFGVLVASDFTFIVSVFNTSDTNNPVAVRMITADSVDNPMVTIVIVDLSEGTYVFSVFSSNSFSPPSDPSSISGSAVVQQRPSTTTTVSTTTTPPTTTSSTSSTGVGTEPTGSVGSSSALPGGAIAGIVIAIIILIAIIAIVAFIVFYIVYQNRGGSYQVEAGKRGGIKVEELDIDIGTELKNTETTEGLLEKPPTTSETSTSEEPRQELHYADLADFGPIKSSKGPSAPAPQAKPMPIEEVQYAVIVPQSHKPPAEDGAE